MALITVERKILEKNDAIAQEIRHGLKTKNIFSFNILSSPGSGKTSLVEKTIAEIRSQIPLAVIEGDVQTNLDAERVAKFEVPVAQIVTNGGCHLEAGLVRQAMQQLDLDNCKLLIIENVGNLVCPAGYDLGEDVKVVVLSVTEGEDKPLKYPAMFRNASVLIINKIDLLPYVDCAVDKIRENALAINPRLLIYETSCKTGEGIAAWCQWIIGNTTAV
jgi:hydrogenase nickel incorporation protein HypB